MASEARMCVCCAAVTGAAALRPLRVDAQPSNGGGKIGCGWRAPGRRKAAEKKVAQAGAWAKGRAPCGGALAAGRPRRQAAGAPADRHGRGLSSFLRNKTT